MKTPLFRLEDAATGMTFFCDMKDCGSNLFHLNAAGQSVCNACEQPARITPTVVRVDRGITIASDRIIPNAGI